MAPTQCHDKNDKTPLIHRPIDICATAPPTPYKGEFVISVIEFIDSYRRTLELTEIEERPQVLENA